MTLVARRDYSRHINNADETAHMHPNHTRFPTIEAIRAASNADLFAWIEWNDRNADFDGMEDETSILRATVAHMMGLYETIEDALRGEGYWS